MPTPNMSLDLPTVSATLGPTWASLLNAALELVDAHDHTSGKGPKVTPAGILINATLNMLSEAIEDANSLGMVNRTSFDVSDYALGSMQVKDNDLYFINSASAPIQITDGSNLFNPGGRLLPTSVSSPYTALQSDLAKVLLTDTTSSAFSVTVPSAADGNLYFWVKDYAGNAQTNNITISTTGGQTIDGDSSYVIDWNYASVGFISDGTSNWYVI